MIMVCYLPEDRYQGEEQLGGMSSRPVPNLSFSEKVSRYKFLLSRLACSYPMEPVVSSKPCNRESL